MAAGVVFKLLFALFGFGCINVALEAVRAEEFHQEPVFSMAHSYYSSSGARKLLQFNNGTGDGSSSDDFGSSGGGSSSSDDFGSSSGGDGGGGGGSSSGGDRIGEGVPACSKDNILVFQGPTAPLPNGIPTYTVEVENVCVSGSGLGSCTISNIHLSCGWFSSARLIDPKVFKRVGYNDCLVNGGQPMSPGQCITFQYANTFSYPLSVSSVTC